MHDRYRSSRTDRNKTEHQRNNELPQWYTRPLAGKDVEANCPYHRSGRVYCLEQRKCNSKVHQRHYDILWQYKQRLPPIHRQPSSRTHSHTTQHERPQQINRHKNTWHQTRLFGQRYEDWGSGKRGQHNRHPNEELTTTPTPKTLCSPKHIRTQNQTQEKRHNNYKQFNQTHLSLPQPNQRPHPAEPLPSRSNNDSGESQAHADRKGTPSPTTE